MRTIKKAFWATVATMMTILGYLANALQFVRNTVVAAFNIPKTIINIGIGFMGICCLIGCVFMNVPIGTKISNAIAMILILLLVHWLASFAVKIIQVIMAWMVTVLNFESIIIFATNNYYKAIVNYRGNFSVNDPRKIDRIMLFGVMYVFHAIHFIFQKINKLLRIMLFPAFGGAAFCWIFNEFYGVKIDTSEMTIGSHILAAFVICLVVTLAMYLAHCVSIALREGADSINEMDNLFKTWSETFRNAEYRVNQENTNQNTYREYKQDNFENVVECNTNKYYQILSAAKDLAEFKKIFRTLCKELHPDVSKLDKAEANIEQGKLNQAYADLKNRYQ